MKLKTVSFQGIKGANSIVSMDLEENFSLLCGKNDAGKSTVLEALDLFFNAQKLAKDHFNIHGEIQVDKAWVELKFSGIPETVVLDSSSPTSLRDENLLNEEGGLTLRKVFSGSKSQYSIFSTHPVIKETGKSLLEMKMQELRKLASEWKVDIDGDSRVASHYRSRLIAESDKIDWVEGHELSDKSELGKNVLPQIVSILPKFHLFRADMVSGESEKFIQDPVALVVEQVLEKYEQSLERISVSIQTDLEESLLAVREEFELLSPSLVTTFSPVDTTPVWKKAFSNAAFVDDLGVPLSNRGSGMRRLALLSFFKANTRIHSEESSVIYAIEEPEAFLHPDLQMEIWLSLIQLGCEPNIQVIITSHSTNFIKMSPLKSIRFLQRETVFSIASFQDPQGDGSVQDSSAGAELVARIERSMGLLSDHKVKCFVIVEGANDIRSLENMTSRGQLEGISSWADAIKSGKLVLLPMGGCGAQSLFSSSGIDSINRPVFMLLDGDDSPSPKIDASDLKSDGTIMSIKLDTRELENVLSRDLIIRHLSSSLNVEPRRYASVLAEYWPTEIAGDSIDVPKVCTTVQMKLFDDSFDSGDLGENIELTKKFYRKESKVKKRIAEMFEHLDEASSRRIAESNLGLLLNMVERSMAE